MKKLISGLLAVTFILSAAGCAPNINTPSSQTQNTSSSPTPVPVYKAYTIYYPMPDSMTLLQETQELEVPETASNEEVVLNALLKGPKGEESILKFNDNAKIRSIKTISGLCTVDFTNNIFPVELVDKNLHQLQIQAIVHSLCALDTVQQVKININGNTAYHLDDSIDLSQPISPDASYLKNGE